MFDQKKLDRINFLAKKNKEEGLTKFIFGPLFMDFI